MQAGYVGRISLSVSAQTAVAPLVGGPTVFMGIADNSNPLSLTAIRMLGALVFQNDTVPHTLAVSVDYGVRPFYVQAGQWLVSGLTGFTAADTANVFGFVHWEGVPINGRVK